MVNFKDFTHCVKCGTCRTVCPVFKATGNESGVARGKIALLEILLNKETPFSNRTLDILNSCVVCGSCQHVCPREVEFIDIIEMAKEKVVKDGQIPLFKKIAMKALSTNKSLNSISKLSKILPKTSGLYFKMPLINKYFPKMQKQLDKKIISYNPSISKKKFDILLFPGCSMRYIFSETGEKLVSVLNKIGIGVYFDSELKCCGFPHLTAGEKEMFNELSKHNKILFDTYKNKVKYIVSGCATCGSAFKNNYDLSLKFKDINEIVKENIDENLIKKINLTTFYHHPCHLMKHQNIKNEPEFLLKETTNFKELDGSEICCGFGGSFSVFESKLSKKIGDNKAESIKKSINKEFNKNKALVTSCPGCMIQLTDSVYRNNIDIPILHIIDIIYKALED